MVWRQLPKLVPAGSIPVSCSKRKGVRRYSGGRLFVCSKGIGKKHKKFPKDGKQGLFCPIGYAIIEARGEI